MELRHLRYAVAVAEELNFRRAAARLHLAAPPLSRAIRDLEREVGVQLFERSTRHVALTADGRRFVARARAVLAHADAMTDGDPARCTLRVGMVADTNETARAVLRALSGEHPELIVERFVLTSVVTRQRLLDGSLDVAVGRAVADHDDRLSSVLIRRERMAVLVRTDDPLAARETVAIADLRDRPLYLPAEAEAPAWHRFVVGLFASSGVREPTLLEARWGRGPSAFADAVAQFGCVAVAVSSDSPSHSDVVSRPLSDPDATYPWSAIYADGDAEPVRWFLEAARTQF